MRTCVGVGGVGAYLCWSGWHRCVPVLESAPLLKLGFSAGSGMKKGWFTRYQLL